MLRIQARYFLPTILQRVNDFSYLKKDNEVAEKLGRNSIIEFKKNKSDFMCSISKIRGKFEYKTLDLKKCKNFKRKLDKSFISTNNFDVTKKYINYLKDIKKFLKIETTEELEKKFFTYEKISTQLNQELILCPSDYPYLYSNIQKSNIFLGNKYHWRSVEESLCTFLTSSKLLNKHWDEFTSACKTEHYPFEKPFHNIYKKELCISPVPSLASHFTNINSVYGLSPFIDYKKLWDENN